MLRHKLVSLVALQLFMALCANGDFMWGNNATSCIYYADGTTKVDAGRFVQLIWAGPDDTPNDPSDFLLSSDDTGLIGDDVVIETIKIGDNIIGTLNKLGRFSAPDIITDDVVNDNYYVRIFSAESPDYANGIAPTGLDVYFGQSMAWSNPGSAPPADPDEFVPMPQTGFDKICTIYQTAIPEPTLLGLCFIGLLSIRFCRRSIGK